VHLRTYAERLLAATDGWFPLTIDPTAVTAEEHALAGVVRCRRLLEGMSRVHDAPDLGGASASSDSNAVPACETRFLPSVVTSTRRAEQLRCTCKEPYSWV
jgi:hypothetical protein